jgi:hypothetical protein
MHEPPASDALRRRLAWHSALAAHLQQKRRPSGHSVSQWLRVDCRDTTPPSSRDRSSMRTSRLPLMAALLFTAACGGDSDPDEVGSVQFAVAISAAEPRSFTGRAEWYVTTPIEIFTISLLNADGMPVGSLAYYGAGRLPAGTYGVSHASNEDAFTMWFDSGTLRCSGLRGSVTIESSTPERVRGQVSIEGGCTSAADGVSGASTITGTFDAPAQ